MPSDKPAEHFWDSVLGRLQVQVTRPIFSTWLQDTIGLDLSPDQLVIGVPNSFTAEWLQTRLHTIIAAAVSAVGNISPLIIFTVHQETSSITPNASLPLVPEQPAKVHEPGLGPSMNPRHTFDAFVVSGSNQLAHAAALAVTDKPGGQFNPLFIYSGVGLGKTHLLQAITHRAIRSGKTSRYLSSEQFTNDFIGAIRDKKTHEFRDYHREVDILLIDDIQFISGKEQTQESFFHTFNHLHDANRQVVITCDRPPSEVPLLTERLRSRFEGGLVTDIQPPDLETRTAILARRCVEMGVSMPDAVIEHLAVNSLHSIRQLLGNFTKVSAAADFLSKPITLSLAETFIPLSSAPSLSMPSLTTQPSQVINAVADYYHIPLTAITGRTRDKSATGARQVAAYLLMEVLQLSQSAIGVALGGRDPATIRYSLKKVSHLISTSPSFLNTLSRIQTTLRERQ